MEPITRGTLLTMAFAVGVALVGLIVAPIMLWRERRKARRQP